MKKLKEIKLKIDAAQQKWNEISGLNPLYPLSRVIACEKKESLKNLLEDIREDIDNLLVYSHCGALIELCKKLLERILLISESLRASYAFAGYNESYFISDTIKIVDGLRRNRN